MRLIDVEPFLEPFQIQNYRGDIIGVLDRVPISELRDAPVVDVAPVVHGRWIRKAFFPDGTPAWVCSVCGHPEEEKYEYCNCGAKMDEEVEYR